MLPKKNICCAILAGGKAERLPDKPFILLKGKPLVSYALDSAEEYFHEVLIVSKKRQEEKLEKITQNKSKIKIIIESSSDFSPWNGIRAAVGNTGADWIFLLACDMPFVCAELFDLLASKINPDIDCVIARTDRLQPLCALYRKTALANANKEGSITRFAESLKKEVVQIPEEDFFRLFNINAKEDFERAKEIISD